MAATVTEVGTFKTTSNVTSLSVTVGSSVIPAAGDTILVVWLIEGNVTPTVADSKANSYAQAESVLFNSSSFRMGVSYTVATAGLAQGDTVTVSWTGSTDGMLQVLRVQGLTSSPLDSPAMASNANQAATTTPSTGAMPQNMAQPDELVLAGWGFMSAATPPTFTPPGAPWTQQNITGSLINAAAGDAGMGVCYQEVSSASALPAATCTLSTAQKAGGLMIPWKVAAVAASAPPTVVLQPPIPA